MGTERTYLKELTEIMNVCIPKKSEGIFVYNPDKEQIEISIPNGKYIIRAVFKVDQELPWRLNIFQIKGDSESPVCSTTGGPCRKKCPAIMEILDEFSFYDSPWRKLGSLSLIGTSDLSRRIENIQYLYPTDWSVIYLDEGLAAGDLSFPDQWFHRSKRKRVILPNETNSEVPLRSRWLSYTIDYCSLSGIGEIIRNDCRTKEDKETLIWTGDNYQDVEEIIMTDLEILCLSDSIEILGYGK